MPNYLIYLLCLLFAFYLMVASLTVSYQHTKYGNGKDRDGVTALVAFILLPVFLALVALGPYSLIKLIQSLWA